MCGIFGFINRDKNKINKTAVRVLGTVNDLRGGDSCGLFIDGLLEYGVEKNKLFDDFMFNSDLLKNVDEGKIILGHCRKASVGAVSKDTAQPIVIKDKYGITKFVLIHNGTIYNYKDLAKKYIPDVNIEDMTDSQVMAQILYREKYDVFSEYNGGSVFLFVRYDDPLNPRVFVFQGKSKFSKWTTKEEVERPFYWLTDENQNIIFSSISYVLEALYNTSCYEIENNMLLELCDGDAYFVAEYKRDNCTQQKEATYNGYLTYYNDNDYYVNKYSNIVLPFDNNYSRFVTYSDGFYYSNGLELNGEYTINKYGVIRPNDDKYSQKYYFFNGILLYNKESYDYLIKVKDMLNVSEEMFADAYMDLINNFSPYPIMSEFYFGDKKYYKSYNFQSKPFTGSFTPIFYGKTIYIKNGLMSGASISPDCMNIGYDVFQIESKKSLTFPPFDSIL